MSKLQQIWELYRDYVNISLMFDDTEILRFDDFAHLHHEVDPKEAHDYQLSLC